MATVTINGKDFLFEVEADESGNPGVYTAVGGQVSGSLSMATEIPDITNKLSTNCYTEIQVGGTKTLTGSVEGPMDISETVGLKAVWAASMNASDVTLNCRFRDVSAGGVLQISGNFAFSSAEMSGELNNAVTNSFSIQNNGEITFANFA